MFTRHSQFKASIVLTSLVISFMVLPLMAGSTVTLADFSSTYSHALKPMEFHFHYVDVPVHVAGLDTKYVMNTAKSFRFETQDEAYVNSFYKPTGQPKIAVDFYLYPNLAGPVTIDGAWQVFVWVNASAYKPAGFDLQFREVDVGGTVVWDSGPVSPIVTSSVGEYIDVPVLNYNLTATLLHTFSPGATILVEVAVNAGSSADTRIWYDSPYFPSKVILPLEDYARPVSVRTYDVNYTETNVYSTLWNETQRKVVVRCNVTDPLGGYDVFMVNVTILNAAQQKVLDSLNMTRTGDGTWETRLWNIYEANWSYPDAAMPGNYSVIVSVVDNNGKHRFLSYGIFEPFIEHGYQSSTIGIQHLVLLRTLDVHNQSLAGAKVQAFSDEVILAEGQTNSSGYWQVSLWAGNYNMTVYWQNTMVAEQPIQVTNASQFSIRCSVYYPVFKIVDDTNETLAEAEVYIASPNGTISIPPFYTDTGGVINLTQAPGGNYTFTIMWKGVKVSDAAIVVNSDGPYALRTWVYQLTVNVLGNDGTRVNGAYVIIYTQSGIGYGLELSDSTGESVFKLPIGTYRIDVRYSTVYWLSAVTANATEPSVQISSSRTIDITLQEYPPPIWRTILFWLVAGAVLAIVLMLIAIMYRRRKARTTSSLPEGTVVSEAT
jgi:hypothetical protein